MALKIYIAHNYIYMDDTVGNYRVSHPKAKVSFEETGIDTAVWQVLVSEKVWGTVVIADLIDETDTPFTAEGFRIFYEQNTRRQDYSLAIV